MLRTASRSGPENENTTGLLILNPEPQTLNHTWAVLVRFGCQVLAWLQIAGHLPVESTQRREATAQQQVNLDFKRRSWMWGLEFGF